MTECYNVFTFTVDNEDSEGAACNAATRSLLAEAVRMAEAIILSAQSRWASAS